MQLFWDRALGSPTGYVLEINTGSGFTTLATLGSLTNNFLDTSAPVSATYRVKATYGGGNSDNSPELSNTVDPRLTLNARIVRGPNGKVVLITSTLPAQAIALRVSRTVYSMFYPRTDYFRQAGGDYFDPTVTNGTFDVALTNLVNGTYEIPTNQVPAYSDYTLYVTSVGHDGRRGNWTSGQDLVRLPFHDGSAQMKQNVSFLLRAGGVEQAFNFKIKDGNVLYGYVWPEDLVYSSLEVSYGEYHFPNEFRPFEENRYFRNFALPLNNLLSSGLLDSGFLPTASFDHIWITNPVAHSFQTHSYVVNSNQASIATGLSSTNSRWIYAGDQFFTDLSLSYSGIYINSSDLAVMPSGLHNSFGLPVISARVQQNSGIFATLYPGSGQLDVWDGLFYHRSHVYQEVTEPVLETVGHYFARISANTTIFLDPFPGTDDFSATNSTPLLIASVGQPIHFAGWARQRIVNGYTNKFAYLGQYFDKAYTTTNGVKTTNQTGILSEYGDFLPTEPGRVILTTKSDPDQTTNQVGEALVHVISLNVDANHDGTMDRTFNGPDQTSAQRPFRFWVNNDHDQATEDVNAGPPDYQDGLIANRRDLEDFARLWITGIPTNQDLSVQISWRNVSGEPAIKLYHSAEADGGIGYLTNTAVADSQKNYANVFGSFVGDGVTLGLVTSTQSLTLSATNFAIFGRKHFLFEGAGIGEGELVLSVIQNSVVIGESSVYFDLHDIKDLYEQAYATNVTSGTPPNSLVSIFKIAHTSVPTSDETPHIVVFVHGINNTEFDYSNSSETIFKRLYWSGYQGRFAGFRWPCAYLPFENTLNPFNYNKGEFYSYKSAKAFKDYMAYLSATPRLAGYTLDVLGHSQGNALVGEALKQGAVFDNYILSQGAIPAECYDASVPTLAKLLIAEILSPTPHNTVEGGYLESFTNASVNLINFFNTNDYALSKGTFAGLQANWEENQRTQKPDSFSRSDGYTTYFFAGTNTFRVLSNDGVLTTNVVNDTHEIRSMVARSRTKAVGAQNDVGGSIANQVDLSAQFGFGETRAEHSAQFTRPVQTVWGYYDEIILGFGMQLNVTR